MNLAVRISCAACAIVMLSGAADASARRTPVREATHRWLTIPAHAQAVADVVEERLYRSCRRKIRRQLGPMRGFHTRSLRIAFAERCVASGGKSW